ncbi:glycosyltransferase [Candidatus Sumerlaeota bacterium]|nr:glycosyltransferase [Candidatus Sumerlaeota bacterium]
MLSQHNIVCFSTEDWDTPLPTNKHQLMVRLAKYDNFVIYIETIGIRRPTLNRADVKRIFRRLKKAFLPPQEKIKNLVVVSPVVLPSRGSGLALKVNRLLTLPRLKKTIRHWQLRDLILWVFNPYAVNFIDSIPHRLLIYHCVDDLSRVPGADSEGIIEAEKSLLQKAHLVFTTSPLLFEKCRKYNPNTYLQPNVGDFKHFNKVMLDSTPVAESVAKIKRPIVMFVGNLAASKVDFDLIEQMVTRRIDWSVVLIGPLWKDISSFRLNRLKKFDNLHILPPVSYKELPSYLKAADVLIIPYLINDYTRSIFPLKFFEFLATGKPVVAMALPSIQKYADIVYLPESYQGFIRAVDEAIKSEDVNKAKRLELARENTWEHRLEELSRLIEAALR